MTTIDKSNLSVKEVLRFKDQIDPGRGEYLRECKMSNTTYYLTLHLVFEDTALTLYSKEYTKPMLGGEL